MTVCRGIMCGCFVKICISEENHFDNVSLQELIT
jgi:hypothetical protein